MSSVISARRRCVGRRSAVVVVVEEESAVRDEGRAGFESFRMDGGAMGVSIGTCMMLANVLGSGLGFLGECAVAWDMRRTSMGLICFPSACV